MKTVKTMACFMAMIMASSVVLVSCKKDKEKEPEVQQTAETPQGKNEVVKTQFAISMPSQLKNGANRMPSTTVQRDGIDQFQGMTGITLIPFAKPGEITSSDFRLGSNIELDPLAKSEVDTKANRAKVYKDVDIPLTTASFLFYAKSAASGTKFQVGSLVMPDLTLQPSTFQFGLECIRTSSEVSTMMGTTGHGGKLMLYLTSIANATDGVKAWYETEDAAMAALFTTFSSLHGLSSAEVERVLTDLNKSLKPLYSNTPANTLATAIATAIANGEYATVNASDEVELVSELDNFPAEYDLPQGCIDVKWDAGSHSFIEGLYSNMADPSTFTYPAQLWYYVNSTIKTSNVSQQTAYASTTNSWDDILALHTAPTNVNSLTRAVAIKDKIQYAVARFDVTVKLDAASLADRSQEAVGIATAVDASAGFPVTAVLVGGQQSVNFDFTSTASGTELTVYDNTMTDGTMKATTAASSVNHTLVLENGTQNVRVAVEMVNTTGVDFYGANDQLIPAGGKFYVVAELVASEATQTSGHVFKQDYTTTANLTLKNLKTAYNTIPDLRTPKLELGFSVDLSWKAGHTYNIDFQ